MYILKNTNIDFVRWRWVITIISLLIVLSGLVVIMTRGLNLGIDFAGGANVIVRFQEAPETARLRSIVPDAVIQRFGPEEDNSILFRLPQQDIEGDYAGEVVALLHTSLNEEGDTKLDLNYQGSAAIAELLSTRAGLSEVGAAEMAQEIIDARSSVELFSDWSQVEAIEGMTPAILEVLRTEAYLGSFNVLSQETVGPQIGRELQRKAFLAIVLAILAMGVYIAIRFADINFGIAAIICLIHDVGAALTLLAFMRAEFEIITVSAMLLIVGYSINDTVVIYDRVRENLRKMRGKGDYARILNLSMNQTLSRTVLTTGTTLLAISSLIIFGGEVIREFSWVLFVGTIAGTYSTISIVPAIVLALRKMRGIGESRRVDRTRAEANRPAASVESENRA
ncbi:MAG: protein translocase subunit SecF [Acidobacteria bacterium]|nr:protein translocase subunit SecF [Acidobacteriota bacterium]